MEGKNEKLRESRKRERAARGAGEGKKTEMGSAVNIGLNRGAIGMNRSGMTLLSDPNLFRHRVFFRVSSLGGVKFSRHLDYLYP